LEAGNMAKKQQIVKETVAPAAPTKTARAAKPKTPRVTTAHHSKTASVEAVAVSVTVPEVPENPEAVIAKIAYSYWESRGCQGGSPLEDWVRAEQEFQQRTVTMRL
jgi:Protein of unknown function (DUF2934)